MIVPTPTSTGAAPCSVVMRKGPELGLGAFRCCAFVMLPSPTASVIINQLTNGLGHRPQRMQTQASTMANTPKRKVHCRGNRTEADPRRTPRMLRAGVGFPARMKLLGHNSPEMTMRYVDVALTDLQREFRRARSQTRHLKLPSPRCRPHAFELASLESLILCSRLNLCWRCSAARCQRPSRFASTGSPTASSRSSTKRANSRPESGHRLAGYARHPPATWQLPRTGPLGMSQNVTCPR